MLFLRNLSLKSLVLIVPLISSCATMYTAQTQMIDEPSAITLIPENKVVREKLEGHQFRVRDVYFEPDDADALGLIPEIPKAMYPKLLEQQLHKAFSIGNMIAGEQQSVYVDVAIKRLQLKSSGLLIPGRSSLRIRVDLFHQGAEKLVSGEYEIITNTRTVPLYLEPGVFIYLPSPRKGVENEIIAISKLIPASAALVSKIVSGLQHGKGLSEIRLIKDVPMGNQSKLTFAEMILSDKPFGLSRLTKNDYEEATKLP